MLLSELDLMRLWLLLLRHLDSWDEKRWASHVHGLAYDYIWERVMIPSVLEVFCIDRNDFFEKSDVF